MKALTRHGGAVLVSFVIGSSAVACARPAPEPGQESPAASAAPALPPALDTRTHGWDLGTWYAYGLHLSSAVSFGDGPKVLDFDVDGVVQVTPTAVTPDDATLYLAMANAKLTSKDPRSQPQFDKVAAEIAGTGCFFTLSGGRVTEMRAPRGLSATAANTYRDIGAALQFARVTSGDGPYTAEEFDTTGQYVAEYAFDRASAVWHKRKQRYIGILSPKSTSATPPPKIVPTINESEGAVRLAQDGHVQSVELQTRVTVEGAQQAVHSTTALSLHAAPSEVTRQPPPDWGGLMAGMQRIGADEPYGTAAPVEALDAARIHGLTFDQVVAGLERIAKAKGAVISSVNGASLDADEKAKREKVTEEESGLFIALTAILRQQPETIAKTVQKIRAKSPASDLLVEALSGASSPAAQNALVQLLAAKSVSPLQHDRIMMALSRTPRPDMASVEALEKTLRTDPFNEIAVLGLGTYSRRLRDAGDADAAGAIGALLVDRLKASQNVPDRLTALRGIANSGYAPALPAVAAFLTDSDDNTRVDAVRALQSMNDPRVDGLLAERMQTDAVSEVRASALSAAKIREPSDALATAVENAATHTEDPHVRYRAVELLAMWVPRRPDVRTTLERIAKTDGEVRIRDRAQSAL